jgi:hypothetical protein
VGQVGHVLQLEEMRHEHKILVSQPEGKKLLGRPRYRGVDNIKMDLKERGCEDAEWSHVAQNELQDPAVNLRAMWT